MALRSTPGCVAISVLTGFLVVFVAVLAAEEAFYQLRDDSQQCAAVPDPLMTKSAGAKIVPPGTENPCKDQKKNTDIPLFQNRQCLEEVVREQAGANVTLGYQGEYETANTPITQRYFETNLCPVNVHWHIGAEHLSVGEYDDQGTTPDQAAVERHRKLNERKLGGRRGHLCHHYDANDPKFTKQYEWKHCDKTMRVGQTYEVHWPHSALGACHTPWQYQEPFYDGVFCGLNADVAKLITATELSNNLALNASAQQTIASSVGVQGQVFTIVNDEDYYYPNLINGMIVEGDMGKDITVYTGSTTGDKRSNKLCSGYSPITWQVDRKCHLISASTFDKMCADMKAMKDDMSEDLGAHGSRETTANIITADNQQAIEKPGLAAMNL